MKKIILTTVVGLGLCSNLMASTGEQLTQKCKSCHGINLKKAPFGRASHVLKKDENTYKVLIEKIKYFQNPEEDDEMVMKYQVNKLTYTEIEKIAKYISELK